MSNNKLYKIKGRLFNTELLYCEGLHKPLLRGKLHTVMLFIQPILFMYLVNVSNSFIGILTSFIYIFGCIFSYGFSAILHCIEWNPYNENMILKFDHAGIMIMIVLNYVPICIMCLQKTGIIMLSCMLISLMMCLYRIFFLHKTTWWEPIVVGSISLISIIEMYEIMTSIAFWSTMASYICSLFGAIIFVYEYPDPYHNIWGFHENMHLLTSIASILVYIANYSIVSRCS